MKPETEKRLRQNYYSFYKKEGHRFLKIRRSDLSIEECELRIIEVRMAKNLGLFQLLPAKQQEVLNLLYPENLNLPRKIDIVKEFHIPFTTVSRLDREGVENLERLFELGPEALKGAGRK